MDKLNRRSLLLKKNTAASLLFQVTTMICGFIIPRLVLAEYGSEINGLVSSIKQFLAVISFLELGVGAVVQSALYKPLAFDDIVKVNQIMSSANSFFKRIGQVLFIYVIVLLFVFPFIINQKYSWLYTGLLIGAISISFFAQYFFGIVDRLFLNSAQYGYVQYNCQTVTLILNAVVSYVLIQHHCSIQTFQLVSSLIFLLRPLYLRYYVNTRYHIQRNVKLITEPIEQKWNGVAQHFAAVVLGSTDVVVLTFMSTLSNVSIYTVYHLVVNGVMSLTLSLTHGIQALEGELWAKKDPQLVVFYQKSEWAIHMLTVLVFSCTALTIVPFVKVYTHGIQDANYVQPLFALLLVLANAGHALRLPYNLLILAAGHYKQTQSNYIVAMFINIISSIVLVNYYGLVGVAAGTLLAMVYQTVWMVLYNTHNLLPGTIKGTLKLVVVDFLCVATIYLCTYWISSVELTYVNWILMGCKVFVGSLLAMFCVNLFFYKEYVSSVVGKVFRR